MSRITSRCFDPSVVVDDRIDLADVSQSTRRIIVRSARLGAITSIARTAGRRRQRPGELRPARPRQSWRDAWSSAPATADSWVRATLALAMLHGAVLAILHARPGLIAVVLWYVEPPLVAIAAAILLAFAAHPVTTAARQPRPVAQLIGYLTLAALIGSLVAFRTYPVVP